MVVESVEFIREPVIIQPLKGAADPYGLHRILYQLRPRFIIMYDCDIAFVRQVREEKSPLLINIVNRVSFYFTERLKGGSLSCRS